MKENYPIFVKWIDTLDWILDRTEKFPKSVRFTFSSRIAQHSLDVLEGIVEAIYTKDRKHVLEKLNLYIEKLRVLFRISFKRRYLSSAQFEYISLQLNETGRMVGGWKKGLK
tara:strand:+ start:345 stop:680 length:336 start_codon:yes stop_codon:yes gene_type:complete